MTQRLSEVLKSADRLNASSTMSRGWFQDVQKSVSRARVHRKILHIGSVAALIVIVLFGGTNLYAQGVAPNHPLYPVKRWSELLVVLVTPRDQKAFVYRHLIDRRVEEAKQDPSLSHLITPELAALLAEQEKIIAEENQQTALSHAVKQTTMFERDIERLRNIRQTREIALALSLSHQRLLEKLQENQKQLSDPEVPANLPPLYLIFTFSSDVGTPTPEGLKASFAEIESIRQQMTHQQTPNLDHLLQFLKARNDLHLQLIRESLP